MITILSTCLTLMWQSLTSKEEVNILVSSQIYWAQREDVVAQTADEPDGPHCACTTGHPPAAKQVHDGQLLLRLGWLLLCVSLQQTFAIFSLPWLQEILSFQPAFKAVDAGNYIQQFLSFLIAALGHQVKGSLGKLPAKEQERCGAYGEDYLVDPPHPHQVTSQSHHHDTNSKGCMHMHRCPCAYLVASELCYIDKDHHQIATRHLSKAKVRNRN